MNFPPKVDGWSRRWIVESKLPPEAGDQRTNPALGLAGRELRLDGLWATQAPAWIAYKHHRFDDASGLEREEVIRDGFVYNGPNGESGSMPVHDFFVEFQVEVLGGSGSLNCRLWDGQDYVVAVCPIGSAAPQAQLRHEGKFDVVRTAKRTPLEPNKKYRIEMAFVDRRVSFAIDGSEPFAPYDLDACQTPRPDLTSPLAIGVKGVNVVIRDLKIYRDIYYRSSGRNAVDHPGLQLGSDEYFMLGDNSANSDDSRSWPIPGVPERNFLGKPFLMHQPSRVTHLTIGGRERVFQSIDWSRIRFLR
jgi:signal peptidase I